MSKAVADVCVQEKAMPTILLIGGNRSTIGSIKALRATGFRVVVAEKLPRQYALAAADIGLEIASGDISGLQDAVGLLGGVDGIIGINETAMASAAELQERFGLIGLSRSVIAKTASKLAQRSAWAGDQALFVPFTTVEALEDMARAIDAVGGFPVIVKPDLSLGGARGVSLVASAADNAAAFAFARGHCLPGSAVVVESALSGPQYSAELMVRDGKTRVLAIGRKVKSEAPYCVDLAIVYPGVTDDAAIAAIEDICGKATSLLGITRGPGHIEFALTEDGPKPIELGARCGGSLTADLAFHVSGYHPMVEAARLACGMPTDDWSNVKKRGAVLMFLAFPPCRARTLHLPKDLASNPAILDADAWLPDDGIIRPVQWTSQRLGYLGVVADDGPASLALALELAAGVRVETESGEMLQPLMTGPRG
jgi:phosphoribosylaminoimidazole carboxylase (NCAIR synthetase)